MEISDTLDVVPIKKILYATDFSRHGTHGFRYAITLSKCFQARMVIFHAITLPPTIPADPTGGVALADYFEELEEESKARLQEMLDEARKHGVEAETLLVDGAPHKTVLQEAKRLGVDLIVVGTHGRTGVEHLLLGSTAEKIVRQSPVPVLVVRHPQHSTATE
ncbi:MAG: universal stress protein [bacterium]